MLILLLSLAIGVRDRVLHLLPAKGLGRATARRSHHPAPRSSLGSRLSHGPIPSCDWNAFRAVAHPSSPHPSLTAEALYN